MEYQEILQEQFNNVVDEESINSILSEAGDITGGLAQQFSAENILNATMEGRSIFDDPAKGTVFFRDQKRFAAVR
jgi:hypothetical protein